MTFSRRTGWDLAPNRLAALAEERRQRGVPTLDLTESNPTRAGLAFAGLREALAPAGLERYEPDPRGLAVARDAVVGYYRERGLRVARDRILLSASSSEAYAWLFKLLCDPGDAILVPRPGYPLFDYLAELESVEVRTFSSRWDGSAWRIDLDALAVAIDARVKAVMLVHPANPTGAFVSAREAEAIEAMCAAKGVAVIADEVFGDYGFERHRAERAPSFAGDDRRALTFTLSGFSKVLALPQVKLGWTVVRGPESLVAAALARLEVVADTYLSVATPIQLAAPALLRGREAIQRAIRERVETNLLAVRGACASPSPLSLLEPEGGWAAVLRVPRILSDEAWAEALLEEEGVLVQPGFFFDFDGPGHLVVSLLPAPPDLARGLDALRALVARRSG